MPESVLKVGSEGVEVLGWQRFLASRKLLRDPPDSRFGLRTEAATIAFQKSQKLAVDGKVGKNTVKAAVALGYDPLRGGFWPKPPDFPALGSNKDRAALFGKFTYAPYPGLAKGQAVRATDGWDKRNLVWVKIPRLQGMEYTHPKKGIKFHQKGAKQLVAMFQAWEDAGLGDRILSFGGSHAPRYQRLSKTVLSSHSWASSFDLNAEWNGQGKPPAALGTKGCVLELVEIANAHGFFWGGHFAKNIDGMHFELAKLMG